MTRQLAGDMNRLIEGFAALERARERSDFMRHAIAPRKLRWRALAVRHAFHVLPGESILEIGAGDGAWSERLSEALRGENPITAVVFGDECFERASRRSIPGVRFIRGSELANLSADSFDYVVGTSMMSGAVDTHALEFIHRVLKPGGEMMFFESNARGKQRARLASLRACGFVDAGATPFDMVPLRTPVAMLRVIQSLAFMVEHAPGLRRLSRSSYVWALKAGEPNERRPRANLAHHAELQGRVSIVVPCRNEEMNLRRLVTALLTHYGGYIREIIVVDDNSSDRTPEIARELGESDARVRLLQRASPNGVGLALRDGIRAASGSYLLLMDSDFVRIVPELRDLFDALDAGCDGAIGSRFSHESLLVNYPFAKILGNRAFHALARLLLRLPLHDVSNNLKAYRSEILRDLEIEEPHFAANAELGLKPLLAGYRIREVPISWISRSEDMGTSSFKVASVAPAYFRVLARTLWNEIVPGRQRRSAFRKT